MTCAPAAPMAEHRRRHAVAADRAARERAGRARRRDGAAAQASAGRGTGPRAAGERGARRSRAELAESAVYKKSKAALQRKLDRLHPADIAYILEALPLDERLYIWDLRARRARRRDPARGLGRRPRVADLVDGHRGARRRDRDARSRRDRRARARPAAGGDGRCVPEPADRGARAAARGDVLRGRHGRRADGLRGHHGARPT